MTTSNKLFFGERLKTLRLEKGLTQTELGKKVGLSRRMIVHYEKHATRPPADKVLALASALEVKFNELVKENVFQKRKAAPLNTKLARKLEQAKKLPVSDQQILSGIVDSFLKKNGLAKKRNTPLKD